MARFWELRGRRVFEHNGILWGRYKGRFYTSFPTHLKLEITAEEAREAMHAGRAFGLRFPSDTLPGMPGGHYIIRDPGSYSLQSVDRRQRSHVNQGLERCEIRPMDPDELFEKGYELNRDTLERQSRADATFLDPRQWRALVDAVRNAPGMMIRGAYANGRLSAYMIGCRDGEWLHLLYKMSRTSDLQCSPNHAIDYSVVREAGTDPGIRYIGNGYTSVLENQGLDRYKRYLGYEVDRHNLCLHFHPAVAPVLLSEPARKAAEAVKRRWPGNHRAQYISEIMEGARATQSRIGTSSGGGAAPETDCQQELAGDASRLARPGALFPLLRIGQTLRKGGPAYMFDRAGDYLQRKVFKKKRPGTSSPAPRPASPDEVLGLKPGEWVEVKSFDEIKSTLDPRGKSRGLLFTPEMMPYVGKRYRVVKRVESIFLEESKQRRTIKNTVILDNVYCHGAGFHCDRTCFLFWKEAWLKRAAAPGEGELLRAREQASGLVQIAGQ
jgi:hypothetical protein